MYLTLFHLVYFLIDCISFPCDLKIVNNFSLETSILSSELKQGVIRPFVKKPSLDHQHCKNFRPISYLLFLSKVLENLVALQLVDYIGSNDGLCEENRSTETVLPL